MGKTFRRNEGRRPKWDKRERSNKSHKLRELEEDKFKHRPNYMPPPEPIEPPDEPMT